MANMYSRPSSSFGYWRGGASDGPLAYGQGSRMGQANSGAGMFPQGSGPVSTGGGPWSPTLTYLLVLVLAEMIIFKWIGKVLR